uniref:Uncharacterized protein n=1 Tax=Meloidogyne javanica TaxID=6303 RepID=A0A915LFD4_MELJA
MVSITPNIAEIVVARTYYIVVARYTAGVQIVETIPSITGQPPIEHWQLLCCHSNSIRVRTSDCVETKFINDFRRSSTFSSSAQIIRRWQAMSENSDKRWWLQICPVDVHPAPKMRKNGDVDIRARRQIPVEWSNSRFSYTPEQQIPSKLKPFFRRGSQNINPNKWPRIPQRFNTKFQLSVAEKEEEEETTTTAMIEQKNITENTTPTTTSKSQILQNEKARTRSTPQETTTENVKTITQTTPINSNEPKKTTTTHPTDVLDYYDIGGLLDGVTDFIQSLQDGLTLAQAAFPAKINMERSDGNGRKGFQLRIAVTNPPNTVDLRNRKETELAFSKDEASSSSNERDDSKRWDDRHNIGSFVQQSDSPVPHKKIIPKRPEATKRESVNTIESMLQMIGLCQGHPEL